MENEIKVGDKYWIEVEVISRYSGSEVICRKKDLTPYLKLIETPEIGKEYEFSLDGNHWFRDELQYFKAKKSTFGCDFIRPIQQPSELEELQQKAEQLGYKLVKN